MYEAQPCFMSRRTDMMYRFLFLVTVQILQASCLSFTRPSTICMSEIRVVTVRSMTECLYHCKKEASCQHFGLGPKDVSATFQCKLLLTDGPAIVLDSSWEYFSIPDRPAKKVKSVAQNCKDLYDEGNYLNGVYMVYPTWAGECGVQVYCDMTTDGGGWLVIVKRYDGSQDFNQLWVNYKEGFGSVAGEFWLGNDNIHQFTTSSDCTLMRTDYTDQDGTAYSQTLDNFQVSDEADRYRLSLTVGSTDADTWNYHDGMEFSTTDLGSHCAGSYTAGMWFGNCHQNLPTGVYGGSIKTGRKSGSSLKTLDMKIKPCN